MWFHFEMAENRVGISFLLSSSRYASKKRDFLFFFLPSSMTSPVNYPGWSCKSLRIFRHLMNSFGVLSWYDSGTGKEGVHPLTISATHLHLSLSQRWEPGCIKV